jgi:hypothetical protein
MIVDIYNKMVLEIHDKMTVDSHNKIVVNIHSESLIYLHCTLWCSFSEHNVMMYTLKIEEVLCYHGEQDTWTKLCR